VGTGSSPSVPNARDTSRLTNCLAAEPQVNMGTYESRSNFPRRRVGGSQAESSFALRQWGDKSRRFGTARRDTKGQLLRGEKNGHGEPMGVPGGPGEPMTYAHDWSNFNRHFGGNPQPRAADMPNATPAKEVGPLNQAPQSPNKTVQDNKAARIAPDGAPAQAQPPAANPKQPQVPPVQDRPQDSGTMSFPRTTLDPFAAAAGRTAPPDRNKIVPDQPYIAPSGYGGVMSDDKGRSVQYNDFAGVMDATHPGFATMTPAQRGNVFRRMAGMPEVPEPPGSSATGTFPKSPAASVPDWQQKIVSKYKDIGVANSPLNTAFLDAYHNGGTPETSMQIADRVAASQPGKNAGAQENPGPTANRPAAAAPGPGATAGGTMPMQPKPMPPIVPPIPASPASANPLQPPASVAAPESTAHHAGRAIRSGLNAVGQAAKGALNWVGKEANEFGAGFSQGDPGGGGAPAGGGGKAQASAFPKTSVQPYGPMVA